MKNTLYMLSIIIIVTLPVYNCYIKHVKTRTHDYDMYLSVNTHLLLVTRYYSVLFLLLLVAIKPRVTWSPYQKTTPESNWLWQCSIVLGTKHCFQNNRSPSIPIPEVQETHLCPRVLKIEGTLQHCRPLDCHLNE